MTGWPDCWQCACLNLLQLKLANRIPGNFKSFCFDQFFKWLFVFILTLTRKKLVTSIVSSWWHGRTISNEPSIERVLREEKDKETKRNDICCKRYDDYCNACQQRCEKTVCYAAFRLACRSSIYHFDCDICANEQVLLDAQGWPSGKQRLVNKSTTLPLCQQRQIADTWIKFNSGATPLCDEPTVAVPQGSNHEMALVKWQVSMKAALEWTMGPNEVSSQ